MHEFRTPASVVGGYLRMLQRDGEALSDRHRKMIEEAEKSCARLVGIIAELSDIGKLDSGALILNRERLDLFALVSDVAEHVQEGRDREVQVNVRGEASAEMTGDAKRLRDAFSAVLRAILREKGGPTLVVVDRRRTVVDGRTCAVVVVADENSVQTAYERERSVFDERRGGLGLALPLARRVIEGHGGALWSPGAPGSSADGEARARGSAIVRIPLTE
ncbi:MAG TPA: HAMP domain-containing sensor histidine kinase [Vicinamibacterales bacterium]|nr:HAMP domain-containing sensor histidine kinase [Vicinamibacterales bacterium]